MSTFKMAGEEKEGWILAYLLWRWPEQGTEGQRSTPASQRASPSKGGGASDLTALKREEKNAPLSPPYSPACKRATATSSSLPWARVGSAWTNRVGTRASGRRGVCAGCEWEGGVVGLRLQKAVGAVSGLVGGMVLRGEEGRTG